MDLRSEAGNAALILALGISGVGGLLIKKNYDEVNVKLKEFKLDKTMYSNDQMGQSSFHATSSILKLIKGMPAVYPDPYLGDSIDLVDLTKGAGAKPWWIKNGVLSINLTESKSYGNPQFNEVFKGNDPKLTDTVKVRLLSAHPSNLRPYYIEFIDVETSIKNEAKADGLSRTVKKRARLKLPPPPDPVCTIVPKDKKVDEDEVSVSIVTSGVSLAGYIQFDRKHTRVGNIPTNAGSINTKDKNIGSRTIKDLKVGDNEIKGYVLNVMNQKIACTSAVVTLDDGDVDWRVCDHICKGGSPAENVEYLQHPDKHGSLKPGKKGWDWMKVNPANSAATTASEFQELTCLMALLNGNGSNEMWGFDPRNNCQGRIVGNREDIGCFAANTMITLDKSGRTLPISAIKPGMMVWNPGLKKRMEVARVIRGPEALPMLRIGYGESTLDVTHGHPFVGRSGVIAAKYLKAGDEILDKQGAWQPITTFEWISPADDEVVWNIALKADSDGYQHHLIEAGGMVSGDLFLQEQLDRLQIVSQR